MAMIESRHLFPYLRLIWILVASSIIGILMVHMFLADVNTRTKFKNSNARGDFQPYYRNRENDKEEPFEVNFDSHEHSGDDDSLAQFLHKEVRVLCWIMTQPINHALKAIHVKRTWGKRCNKLLFMSSTEDKELGTVALPVSESRESLWNKTKEAFKYIYKHHLDDADWFLKADDDTYSVVENLRYMLYPYSPDTPIYFGCKFKPFVEQGYMSGGAGYVLSKEALRRIGPELWNNNSQCNKITETNEDLHIGICLEKLEVIAGDSRDDFERGRMFPFSPGEHLVHNPLLNWYLNYSYYTPNQGLNCCSDHAITFHYIDPRNMYALDYLIYHLHPVGVAKLPVKLPPKLDKDQVIQLYKPLV